MIPDVRLRLLNMDSGKKYSRMEMDMKKRSDLRPISMVGGIVADIGVPRSEFRNVVLEVGCYPISQRRVILLLYS